MASQRDGIDRSRAVCTEAAALAVLVAITVAAIGWLQPSLVPPEATSPVSSPADGDVAVWIVVQAASLCWLILLAVFALAAPAPRLARWLGSAALLAMPAVMVADAITFRWISQRFLAFSSWRLFSRIPDNLLPYTSPTMRSDGAWALGLTTAGLLALWVAARFLGRRWTLDTVHTRRVVLVSLTTSLTFVILGIVETERLGSAMKIDSPRHPFCVFRLYSPGTQAKPSAPSRQPSPDDSFRDAITRRQHQQRHVTVLSDSVEGERPDVLIVIIESFRRELVTPEVMPHLCELGKNGTFCRQHFSGGNASNHGIFSLLNGLEAIWFQQPITYSPLFNRLFHAAGYEVGFFAGHDDWRRFLMDGFIASDHYDDFQCAPFEGLRSDRKAIESAIRFLNGNDTSDRKATAPRAAILYLYATHAIYESYVEDQVFQPAADDRLHYPYGHSVRDQVWNRYRNSARSIDRLLSATFPLDSVLLITGDHGEAFLEDGTIGHGTKISEYQNITPAILHGPKVPARSIDVATSHADLLPTLLALAGVRLSNPRVFDGVNLCATTDEALSQRVLISRNYLDNQVALIGPWSSHQGQPFAYLADVSLRTGTLVPGLAIGANGNPYPQDDGSASQTGRQQQSGPPPRRLDAQQALERWQTSRFTDPPG